MAQAKANKLYRTFVKGLVTEASPLTFPEDTSQSENNTILSRKGTRVRRLGMSYGADNVAVGFDVSDNTFSQGEFVWKAVSKQPNTDFLVIQQGRTISFWDLRETDAVDREKSFTVDMSLYLRPGASSLVSDTNEYQMASGQGRLYIVSRDTEPVFVEYDEDTDTISTKVITILIRDFEGLEDGLANDEEPSVLSKEHHYNLMNQGWLYGSASASTFSPVSYTGYTLAPESVQYYPYPRELEERTFTSYQKGTPTSSPIFRFQQVIGRYPGNNKQWWVARAEADNPDEGLSAGDFLPEVLNRLFSGNNRAPTGHYILNAFYEDRSAVSGISNISIEETNFRPEAVAFFSGRTWYGAGTTVYFSQILDSRSGNNSGLCYQEADPTAEDISDLIQSDGGMIPIPEADRIVRLMPIANGVLVFAENGVWFISGGDSAFAATNLAVDRVSSLGTKAPKAAIEVEGTIFWWSETGIQGLEQASGQFGPIPGKFGNTNITEQTIQTLFVEIPENNKRYVKVAHDHRNNRLIWLYNDGTFEGIHEYNKALIFDLTLQAFFVWGFSYIEDGPIVSGIFNNIAKRISANETTVLDSNGETVVNSAVESVVIPGNAVTYAPSSIEFIANIPTEGFAFTTSTDTTCLDWVVFDGTGATYDSYVQTGFELMNDAMREKQMIYLFAHFKQQSNSSCKFICKWDWSDDSSSGKWTDEVEAYRERVAPLSPTYSDRTAFEIVTSKLKVRGSGRAIQFRFGTSEANKNFELLGWSVAYVGNTEP